jgi:hypothetical protein
VKAIPKKRVPLRRQRIAEAATDVQRGLKDTERRGTPSDVPASKRPASLLRAASDELGVTTPKRAKRRKAR